MPSKRSDSDIVRVFSVFGLTLERRYHQLIASNAKRGVLSQSPLKRCWDNTVVKRSNHWRECEFLVADTETSSLDVATGEMLSIGWVVIRGGRIPLTSARHLLLKPRNSVGSSATIHQIRDCELDAGLSESTLMAQFLEAAQGRVLVFHHAVLDVAFLSDITRRLYGAPLLMPAIDTLQLEKRRLERADMPLGNGALRLGSCCSRYNLPPSQAHNALTDALATAELLLAQIAHKGGDVTLGDLL